MSDTAVTTAENLDTTESKDTGAENTGAENTEAENTEATDEKSAGNAPDAATPDAAQSQEADRPATTEIPAQEPLEDSATRKRGFPKPSVPGVVSRTVAAGSRRLARLGAWRIRIVTAIVVLAFAAAAVALGITAHQHQQDRTAATASADALAAANRIVPDLLTYKADGIDADFAAKYKLLTGSFQGDFTKLTQQTIIPAAKQRNITTQAKVAAAGVIESTPTTASVLMFINQSTTSTDDPDPTLDGSRIRVSLTKDGDTWKVSGLQPV